jgi:hypothetical protein
MGPADGHELVVGCGDAVAGLEVVNFERRCDLAGRAGHRVNRGALVTVALEDALALRAPCARRATCAAAPSVRRLSWREVPQVTSRGLNQSGEGNADCGVAARVFHMKARLPRLRFGVFGAVDDAVHGVLVEPESS